MIFFLHFNNKITHKYLLQLPYQKDINCILKQLVKSKINKKFK